MTEEEAFESFHSALDSEPPPGAWERLHAALAEHAAQPAPRRLRWPGWQPVFRPLAGLAAAVLVLAVAAAAFAWHASNASPPQGGPITAPGRPEAVYSVTFVSPATGWVAVGGALGSETALYFTRDGGLHWTRQASLGKDAAISRPQAFDTRQLVFLAWDVRNQRARLARTEDGGAHFNFSELPAGSSYWTSSFLSSRQGWVYDSRAVYATNDGGATWRQTSATDAAHGFDPAEVKTASWVQFVDGTNGFLGTTVQDGLPRIHVTYDGGGTWTLASIAYPPGLDPAGGRAGIGTPPRFTDSRQGTLPFYYVPNQAAGGVKERIWVLSTQDGGRHWSVAAEVPAPLHWNGPAVPPPLGWNGQTTTGPPPWTSTHWQLAFEGRLLLTTDAGRTWSWRTLPLPTGYSINAMRLEQDQGWVLAANTIAYFNGAPRQDILLQVTGPRLEVTQVRLPTPAP